MKTPITSTGILMTASYSRRLVPENANAGTAYRFPLRAPINRSAGMRGRIGDEGKTVAVDPPMALLSVA